MRTLIVFFLVFLPAVVHAADWKPLEGTFAVTSRNYLDPSREEPVDSHFRLQLTGETAKALYDAMHVDPVEDECTGYRAKNIGEMQCLFDPQQEKYDCHFSVEIGSQRIGYGVAC